MKLSQFHQGRSVPVKLSEDEVLNIRYNPRFLTQEVFGFYDKFLKGDGEDDKEYFDIAYNYLAGILQSIDIQDDNGKDIAPTVGNLRDVIRLDFMTLKAIHAAIVEDMNERANPTSPEGEESSSG